MAINPAHMETMSVMFWSQMCGESKNETIRESNDTIAEVGPISADVPLLLIKFT
jgi:hypothetical protein